MDIAEKLLEKSKESFVLAVEIYNKPTIKYRLEGFSFLICNAWELMLKSHIIKTQGEDKIYYKDKSNRTLSLDKCINIVFSNKNSPLNQNLTKILELRNTSTHFITEEYEIVYAPLLQACVINFIEKMKQFHSFDMCEILGYNFITLATKFDTLEESYIQKKYPPAIANHLISVNNDIKQISENSNERFSINVCHYYYNTKDKNKATEFYHIDKDAVDGVKILKTLQNPNDTHPYTQTVCISHVNKKLNQYKIELIVDGKIVEFNRFYFRILDKQYNIKGNEKYCFKHTVPTTSYSYSPLVVEFIFDILSKEPCILDSLKKKLKKEKKSV